MRFVEHFVGKDERPVPPRQTPATPTRQPLTAIKQLTLSSSTRRKEPGRPAGGDYACPAHALKVFARMSLLQSSMPCLSDTYLQNAQHHHFISFHRR